MRKVYLNSFALTQDTEMLLQNGAITMQQYINNQLPASHYVDTAGNDITGNGSQAAPFATLKKACEVATTPGNIIHINAGTYTETDTCILSVGVSIEGEGTDTILKSSFNNLYKDIISARSAEGTSGGQHISYLQIDGQNATSWGIAIFGRSNVSIHNCYLKNIANTAVMCLGRNDFDIEQQPGVYAVNNKFYSNIIENCSGVEAGHADGALWLSGQVSAEIYNNSITQTQRADGQNGYCIKLTNFTKGVQIYNNTLTKKAFPYVSNGSGDYWNFTVEVGDCSGLNIYNNTITGSIDVNRITKGTYEYGLRVANNTIGNATLSAFEESGVILEFSVTDVIITGNTFKNMCSALYFSTRNGSTLNNVSFTNNLCYNIGAVGGTGIPAIQHVTDGSNNYVSTNFHSYNNTIIASSEGSAFCFSLSNAGSFTGLKIINNVIQGFNTAAIVSGNATPIQDIEIKNNCLYNNGNGNNPAWYSGAPVLQTITNNINSNPLLDINYRPAVGSPLINAGLNIGIPYNGAAPDIGYFETA